MRDPIYVHTQTSPASTWTITHNLGCKPQFDLVLEVNGQNLKAYPEGAVHTDDNTLTLTFSTNRTGVVRVIGA